MSVENATVHKTSRFRPIFNPIKNSDVITNVSFPTMAKINPKKWGLKMMQHVSPAAEFTPITKTVTSNHNKRMSETSLRSIFPVLAGASVVESDREFLYDQFDADKNRKAGMLAFDTQHHGRVYLMCFVCHPHFKLNLAIEKSDMELLILTENFGSVPTNHDVLLTMLVPITGCEMCKTVCENMSKCDRCWKDARFPVRYCSRDCQV